MSLIQHYGFWSLCDVSNPQSYVQTTENNQEYIITSDDGRQLELNSIVFVSIDTPLFVKINDNTKALPILTGHITHYNYQVVKKFTILGNAGTKFMAYAQYF